MILQSAVDRRKYLQVARERAANFASAPILPEGPILICECGEISRPGLMRCLACNANIDYEEKGAHMRPTRSERPAAAAEVGGDPSPTDEAAGGAPSSTPSGLGEGAQSSLPFAHRPKAGTGRTSATKSAAERLRRSQKHHAQHTADWDSNEEKRLKLAAKGMTRLSWKAYSVFPWVPNHADDQPRRIFSIHATQRLGRVIIRAARHFSHRGFELQQHLVAPEIAAEYLRNETYGAFQIYAWSDDEDMNGPEGVDYGNWDDFEARVQQKGLDIPVLDATTAIPVGPPPPKSTPSRRPADDAPGDPVTKGKRKKGGGGKGGGKKGGKGSR